MTDLITPDRPLLAEVMLELFDAETGRKVDESAGENYITPVGLEYARWSVRNAYKKAMPTNMNQDLERTDPFGQVYMTDSGAPIDTGSSHPEGVLQAWASKASYSGADTMRGSLNVTESESDLTRAKWVFDWPTTAGNGTIRSVGFTYSCATDRGISMTDPYGLFPRVGMTLASSLSMLRPDGMIVYGTSSMGLWDPALQAIVSGAVAGPTAAQVGSLPGGGFGGGCHDGVDMYVTGSGNGAIIRKFPLPTGAGAVSATTITVPGATALGPIIHDGTMLWVRDRVLNKVFRVDDTTGAIDREFTCPGFPSYCTMTFNPNRQTILMNVNSPVSGRFNEYDLDGVLVGNMTGPNQSVASYGIVWIGGDEYVLSGYNGNNNYSQRLSAETGTRILLPASVTKNSLQTMKLTYTFTYS